MAEATQGEATIVGGRYRVMPEIRLEEFDRTHIEAFAVEDISFAIEKGEILNAVNIATQPPVQGTLVVRHLDRVGVLASLLSTLRGAAINVETMENIVFEGGISAPVRTPRGRDIDAACGQLAGKVIARAARVQKRKAELRAGTA